jgi:hypothetical protein
MAMSVLEMAFTRKKAEQIVTGLERPLNRHLVKLLALQAPEETRAAWKREVKRWLREIAALRLKPAVTRLKASDLNAWLYDEPFGGVEELNTRFLIQDSLEEGFVAHAGASETAARLKALHETLSVRLAAGDPAVELVDGI